MSRHINTCVWIKNCLCLLLLICLNIVFYVLVTKCFVFAGFPSLDKLTLLKRRGSDGQELRLRIIEEVCPKWNEMGDLMCLSACRLKAIEENRRGKVRECCRDVFSDWLEQEGGGDYPVTWQGLCVLLVDLKFSAFAKQVQQFFQL